MAKAVNDRHPHETGTVWLPDCLALKRLSVLGGAIYDPCERWRAVFQFDHKGITGVFKIKVNARPVWWIGNLRVVAGVGHALPARAKNL